MIDECDMFICEATYGTPAVGYQICYSISKKKPTLVLFNENHEYSSWLYLSGSNNSKMLLRKYSKKSELGAITKEFVNRDHLKNKIRLNFFLEEDLHDKIEQQVKKTGETKTDIIKKALSQLMN